jgi:hypothetical protein
MQGVWQLPSNYDSIPIVLGTTPHRYRISFAKHIYSIPGKVMVEWDGGEAELLAESTIDVTAPSIRIVYKGQPRDKDLTGGYDSLD